VSQPARKRATYEDVIAAPEHLVAELIDGELVTMPRPAALHAAAATALGEELGPPFKRGRGGPGGWVILDEPELHLRDDVLVPDLASWRRERMPEIPDTAAFELAPDWVCEVLSPSTEALDRTQKVPIYSREAVTHVWLVNPRTQTLEVLELAGNTYSIVSVHQGNARVRAVPFDSVELDLAVLWER
jgi:Uma2 family endonuclease